MKRAIICAAAGICALLALLTAGYAVRYAALEDIMARAGGADAACFAVVYGARLDDAALGRARDMLGAGAVLTQDADGRAYACLAAGDAWQCAALELRARGALGAWARADRWVEATGANALSAPQRGADGAIEARPRLGGYALDAALRLLCEAGDSVRGSYAGERSASARGDRYHAAARMGDEVTYMLAEGYLPIDY